MFQHPFPDFSLSQTLACFMWSHQLRIWNIIPPYGNWWPHYNHNSSLIHTIIQLLWCALKQTYCHISSEGPVVRLNYFSKIIATLNERQQNNSDLLLWSNFTWIIHFFNSSIFFQKLCNSHCIGLVLPHPQVQGFETTIGKVTIKWAWYRANSWKPTKQHQILPTQFPSWNTDTTFTGSGLLGEAHPILFTSQCSKQAINVWKQDGS